MVSDKSDAVLNPTQLVLVVYQHDDEGADGPGTKARGSFKIFRTEEEDPATVIGADLPAQPHYPEFHAAAQRFHDASLAEWVHKISAPGELPVVCRHHDLTRRLLPTRNQQAVPPALEGFCSKLEVFSSTGHFQALPYLHATSSTPYHAVFVIVWVHKSLITDVPATLASLRCPPSALKECDAMVPTVFMRFGTAAMKIKGMPEVLCPGSAPKPFSDEDYVAAWESFCGAVMEKSCGAGAAPLHTAAVFGYRMQDRLFRGPWQAEWCPVPIMASDDTTEMQFKYTLVPKAAVAAHGVLKVLLDVAIRGRSV
jgi:hypothetical protein